MSTEAKHTPSPIRERIRAASAMMQEQAYFILNDPRPLSAIMGEIAQRQAEIEATIRGYRPLSGQSITGPIGGIQA